MRRGGERYRGKRQPNEKRCGNPRTAWNAEDHQEGGLTDSFLGQRWAAIQEHHPLARKDPSDQFLPAPASPLPQCPGFPAGPSRAPSSQTKDPIQACLPEHRGHIWPASEQCPKLPLGAQTASQDAGEEHAGKLPQGARIDIIRSGGN